MTAGLRELLELPNLQNNGAPNGDFRQAFLDSIAGLNGDLQLLAAQGERAAHEKLASQRQTLYTAYQTAAPQNDPPTNERVIAAVAKTGETASAQKANTVAGREEWLKRQAEFDAAVVKIGELEDAGHPKAATYRALSDKILAQANARDYQKASAVLDTMEPKLTEAHTLYVNSANSGSPGRGETKKSKSDSDIGSAKTIDPQANTAQAPPSNNDAGNAKTPMAPTPIAPTPMAPTPMAPPSNNGVGNAKTPLAPAPNNELGSARTPMAPGPNNSIGGANTPMAPPQPNQNNTTGTGDDAPRIPASTGDGQKVEIKEAFDEMRKKDGKVRESGSSDYHRRIWQQYMGKTGEPPLAFRYSNEIRIDVERLTPEQHKQWLELDKAKNPTRYPQPVKTPAKPPVAPAPVASGSRTVGDTVDSKPAAPKAKPQPKGGQIKGWYANVAEISPQLTLQRSSEGVKVHPSVSPAAHQTAWEDVLGKSGKAPVAYMVDNMIHVDMDRWPKDMPPPKLASGGGTAAPKAPTIPPGTVNVKSAEAFVNDAKANKSVADELEKKAVKGGGTPDTSKLTKQTKSLESTADSLAKQFESHPDFKELRGGNTRQFFQGVKAQFSSVRGGAAGIVVLALNVADAYEMVQAVRNILDSKSVDEALRKSFQLGVEVAKGAIQFGALRFAFRSTPLAIGVTVFLGDMDKNSRLSPRQQFAREVMKLVNSVSPGAVDRLGHMGTTSKFRDGAAEKLFENAVAQAEKLLKENMAKEPRQIGYNDGLTGTKTKTDFEVSSDEKDILRIDEKWLKGIYLSGVEDGKKRRLDALPRAKAEGQEDGKSGKPSNPERLNYWYEVKHVLKRIDNTSGDEKINSIAVLNEYYDRYKEGYAAGRKGFQTAVIEKIEITPKSFSMGTYSTRRLVATGIFKDGKTLDLTDLVKWSSDNPDAVKVDKKNDLSSNVIRPLDGIYAHLNKPGKAVITAEYRGSNGAPPPAKITITVTEPKLSMNSKKSTIYPGKDGKYMIMVDEKDVQFGISVWSEGHWDDVPEFLFDWKATPSDVVSVDMMGHVRLFKAGKATIIATEKKTGAVVKAEISVEPKGSMMFGQKI